MITALALLAAAALCYLASVLRNKRLSLASLIAPASALTSALAVFVIAAPARADVSAWMFVGGGAMGWKSESQAMTTSATMTIDVGAGTSPDRSFIGGGLFRIQPIFGSGADLALLARFCNHGFQAGKFGFAVDAGAFARPWGDKSIGFSGGLSLGLPLGFTVTAQGQVGTAGVVTFGAVAGLDLLRFTIYRQSLLDWWQNPSPAYQRQQTARGSLLQF